MRHKKRNIIAAETHSMHLTHLKATLYIPRKTLQQSSEVIQQQFGYKEKDSVGFKEENLLCFS